MPNPTTPPLRDAHLHLAEQGHALITPSVADARSIDDVLRAVTEAAQSTPRDRWLTLRGLRPEALSEHRFPSAAELDDAADRGPDDAGVVINTLDIHSFAVNSGALRAAGITADTPDPPKGVIVRDGQGNPTGTLLETASWLVRDAMPKPTTGDVRSAVSAAIDDLLHRGIREAHEMHARPPLLGALATLLTEDPTLRGFRLRMYATPEFYDESLALFDGLPDNDAVTFDGLKLFTDGTINSRTASMLHPFADPVVAHPRGIPNFSDDELRAHISTQIQRATAGTHPTPLGVAAHAIGDAAVRALLDAYDAVEQDADRAGDAFAGLRIEHAQFIDETDIPRFTRTTAGARRVRPVIASMQPCHLLPDMEPISRLLPHRSHRAMPVRDLVEAAQDTGFAPTEAVWFGSDAPVVEPNPADNAQAAVYRRRADPDAPAPIAPDQSITAELCEELQRTP